MEFEYLRPFPSMPAIREAMAQAVHLKERGVQLFDFSSGNVGNLLFNIPLFKKMKMEVNDVLAASLQIIASGISDGIVDSIYPIPRGLGYSPSTGTPNQKKWVIRYMRNVHGVPLTDEDIHRVACTAGGQLAMAASLRSIKPGTTVFSMQWDYSPIPSIVSDNGCKLARIKVHEDLSLDIDELNRKVTDKSVFYISMPNNPTGYTSVEDLKSIAELMKTREGGLVWDAPYLFTIFELSPKEAPIKARFNKEASKNLRIEFKKIGEQDYEHLCILSSLSKTCLIAGLRFGFVTANPQWIANVEAIVGRENLSAPTLSFITGRAMLQKFLETPIAHEWMCNILANRITTLLEEEIPLIMPKNGLYGALYALVRTPKEAKKSSDELLKKGIVTVPGSSFCGEPTNAVRLSLVAVPWVEGDEEWISSVKTLKKALKQNGNSS